MSTIPQYSSGKAQTQPYPWLWAAVGALGATTLALGVTLVQMRVDPTPVATQTPTQVVALPALSTIASSPAAPVALAESYEQKQPSALVKQAPVATKKVAQKNAPPPAASTPPSAVTAPPQNLPGAAQTSAQPVMAALPPPPPPKVVCTHCGTVTAVTPVEQDGAGSGAGAVAGAVLGGLLGNQVGGGTGKTIATVVGAVGGGYAGNTVEKRMKKETVYHIDIRMDDGSTQRLQHRSPLSVGAPVTVNGGVITAS
jgi:outer membrane lipoprotein SlyB